MHRNRDTGIQKSVTYVLDYRRSEATEKNTSVTILPTKYLYVTGSDYCLSPVALTFLQAMTILGPSIHNRALIYMVGAFHPNRYGPD